MMNPNLIDYYIINCPIPSKIAIENRYQIDFGNPDKLLVLPLAYKYVGFQGEMTP